MPHLLRLLCPAKVNLALSVGPPREDGYHPIASWMAAVNWGDELTARRCGDKDESGFRRAIADDAPQPQPIDWPLDKDLAFRAHHLLEESTGRQLPIELVVHKRVPAGAGLAGGSGNAAAVLLAVNDLFSLGLSLQDLTEHSRRLGSDVAFLLASMRGSPSALVTGLGEQIEPSPLIDPIHLVLILPPFGCPTGAVYRAFDEQIGTAATLREQRVRELAAGPHLDGTALFNDLAGPAGSVTPALRQTMAILTQTLKLSVHVTGSGAAMFAVAPTAEEAGRIADRITRETGLPTVSTRTLAADPSAA